MSLFHDTEQISFLLSCLKLLTLFKTPLSEGKSILGMTLLIDG